MISADRPDSVVYDLLLALHILSGFLGLASAFVPLIGAKGGENHRRWGRVFVWAMGFAAATALPLGIWTRDGLQLLVALFSGYLALYGSRILRRGQDGRLLLWERGLGAIAFVGFLSAAIIAAALFRRDPDSAKTTLAFAGVGMVVALGDVSSWSRADRSPRARMANHMTAMILAVAGGWAAFLNTQGDRLFHYDGSVATWMLPPVWLAIFSLFVVVPRRLRLMRRESAVTKPEAHNSVRTLRTLRTLGIAEGISFLALLLIAVPAMRLGGDPTLVRLLGPVHGSLVLMYLTAGFLHARSARWPLKRIATMVIASAVPLGTFVFDRNLRKEEQAEGEKLAA